MINESNAAVTDRLSEQELCPGDLLAAQEAAFARDIARLQARRDEFVEVPCPACGGVEAKFELEKVSFSYHSCLDCRTLYMSPRPSEKLMADYYSNSENYQFWAEHIFPASEASRREKLHKPWFARVLEFCERFDVPTQRLLEVGAGFGTFCQVAVESNRFDGVVAVEPTPEMAEACRQRGLSVIERRIEDVSLQEVLGANVVVAFEVIEHLFAPREFLAQCARVLPAGGLLVMSCPNGLGFDITTLRELSMAVDTEHVNLFNPRSLTQLVESCGFQVLEVSTPGRLDAEFVHDMIVDGKFDVSGTPFLQRVLVDEWDRLGWPFQQFLAENGLSSHMWLAARRRQV